MLFWTYNLQDFQRILEKIAVSTKYLDLRQIINVMCPFIIAWTKYCTFLCEIEINTKIIY